MIDYVMVGALLMGLVTTIVCGGFLLNAYNIRCRAMQTYIEVSKVKESVEKQYQDVLKVRQEAIEYWKKIDALLKFPDKSKV